jgi:hypothetical protein
MSVNRFPPGRAAFVLVGVLAGDAAPVRAVFVCDDAGIAVYSDRPCSPVALPRELRLPQPPVGPDPGTRSPASPATTRLRVQPRDAAGPCRSAHTRCATLHRQLDEVNERMRTGYSSREAARLWQRWRDLRHRLRAERC